jgi:hypothetical protein
MRTAVLAIIFALLAWPVFAGEISVLGGYGVTNNPVEKTFACKSSTWRGLAIISPTLLRM